MDQDNTLEPIEKEIVDDLSDSESENQDQVNENIIEPIEQEIVDDFDNTINDDAQNIEGEEEILEPVEQEIVDENTQTDKTNLPRIYKRRKRIPKWLRFSVDEDIKYRGPLSYRTLRIFAWVFLCLSQLGAFLVFAGKVAPAAVAKFGMLGEILSQLKATMMPLFLIATFSILLNKSRKFSSLLFLYGGFAILFFLLFILIHDRFIIGIVMSLGETDRNTARETVDMLFSGIFSNGFLSYNIFIDLFFCTLFVCFLTHTPKKIFVGKKLIIFRLFALFPVAYEIGCLIIKGLTSVNIMVMSPYMYPFLTTKPPMTFIVFVVLTIYLKIRERIYNRAGLSQHDYNTFLKSKRNSWYFSVFTSSMIAIAVFVDFLLLIIVSAIFTVQIPAEETELAVLEGMSKAIGLGFGQSVSMILVIPFILLFSYTRTHKDTRLDMAIPIIGLIALALVYFEELYQIMTQYVIPQLSKIVQD